VVSLTPWAGASQPNATVSAAPIRNRVPQYLPIEVAIGDACDRWGVMPAPDTVTGT